MKKEKKNQSRPFMQKHFALEWVAELFHRYFTGEATEKEKEIVETWDPQNTPAPFKATPEQIEEGSNRIWKKLSSAFGFEKNDTETDRPFVKELPELPSLKQPRRKIIPVRFIRKYAAVAAILLIISGITLIFLHPAPPDRLFVHAGTDKTHYLTGLNEIKKIELADGSVLYLNGGTDVSLIDEKFNKKKREIWLEGEAFFEVAKDPDRPFIIHSGKLQTIVRGTSFNIKAYKELNENVISVRSGKVEVRKDAQVLGVLTRNRQLIYQTANDVCKSGKAGWESAAAWRDGNLVLNNADIGELKLRLHQHFGVEVACTGDVLYAVKFNAIFQKESSLNDVLENISMLYGAKYRINGKQVTLFR